MKSMVENLEEEEIWLFLKIAEQEKARMQKPVA